MAHLQVNFDRVIGKIRPMHGVGQPPFVGMSEECFPYLTRARIPYSRLHDVGGAYGGGVYVDIPNLFRDFSADENDPASYDFAFTDWLIGALIRHGCEPIFRLGVTIENYYNVRSYRIHPPKDFAKWARICEHVVRHYLDGWADGFHYKITYWEIWNEPDNCLPNGGNQMWTGTAEDYYDLYCVAARVLKDAFGDRIKVGGFASCGFYALFDDLRAPDNEVYIPYFLNFLKRVKAENAPLDFFSWHSYADTERTAVMARYVRETLAEYGFEGLETQLNEWNNAPKRALRGTSQAAARAASMMIAQQNEGTGVLCYYDARVGASTYGGLFNPITFKPFCAYYAFYAFGVLYALAASDGKNRALLLANTREEPVEISANLPSGLTCYLIDQDRLFAPAPLDPAVLRLAASQVALITDAPVEIEKEENS